MDWKAKGGLGETARVAWPLVASQAAGALMLFVDRTMLARFDDTAIQASLPAGVFSYMIVCFFQAVAGYSGTFVAQFYGAGRRAEMAKAFGQGMWITALSAPLMLASIPLAHWCMENAGHRPEVLAGELTYFNIVMAGALPLVATGAVNGFFAGRGRTRIVMAAAVAGNALNILLDWLLIFGKWGCPRMGLAGAAWATVAAQCATLLIPAALLLREPLLDTGRKWREAFMADWGLLGRIVRYGAPNGVQTFLDMATFTGFVMLTGKLTALEFALSNICFTINHLVFAPLYGFGMTASILAGQHQGAREPDATARSCRTVLALALGYMAVVGGLILCFHESLLGVFYGENTQFARGEFMETGFTLLLIAMVWGVADAAGLSVSGTLKGVGETKFVMMVSGGLNVLLWAPMFVGVMAWKPEAWAMWLTVPAMLFVDTAAYLARFFGGGWRGKTLAG